jgi:hypothetical protein
LLNYHASGFILKAKISRGKQPPQVPELSQFQKEIIFGCMLGDVSAEKTSERGDNRIRFYMSNKNKDYIFIL